MPSLITKLPVKGDLAEADFIYSNLISYLTGRTQEMQPYAQELLKVFATVLGSKEKKLNELDLSEQTMQAMVGWTKTVVTTNNIPLEALFTAPMSAQRFQARLQ